MPLWFTDFERSKHCRSCSFGHKFGCFAAVKVFFLLSRLDEMWLYSQVWPISPGRRLQSKFDFKSRGHAVER